MVCARLTS